MRRAAACASALLACLALGVCGGGGEGGGGGASLAPGPEAPGFSFAAGSEVEPGRPLASRFTCDGEDAPPRLRFTGVPAGTAELALVLEDPDAPGGTFTHWLVYGLPPAQRELGGLAGSGPGREGRNDFGDRAPAAPARPRARSTATFSSFSRCTSPWPWSPARAGTSSTARPCPTCSPRRA